MRRVMPVALLVGLVAWMPTACHTITEDLPSRASQVNAGGGAIPVVVVPIPSPTPTVPPVTDNPTPRPTAQPTTDPGGEPPVTNRSPVVKLNAHVYFVECNGAPVDGSGGGNSAPVGCRVHFDCTARDAHNDPTVPNGIPRWTYGNPGILTGGNSGFNPVITATGAGCTDYYAQVDGVTSSTSSICFH